MKDLKKIRFIATNYYNLQGLRALPLGLCLILVCVWANTLQGPARGIDFLWPIAILVGSALLLFAFERYYTGTFGRVQRTAQSRRLEGVVGVVFGILALATFYIDVTSDLPVNLLGLTFAAGLLVDYVRVTWLVKGRFLIYYPLGAVLMALISVLPLLGISEWWELCGLRSQMIGIAIAIGLFTMIAGFWGHIFLVRLLRPESEAK